MLSTPALDAADRVERLSPIRLSTRARWLKLVRQLHLYLGVLSAPALLFFAVSGALQTFSLHETKRGSDYQPPAWLVILGQIHKKQVAEMPVRRPQDVLAGAASKANAEQLQPGLMLKGKPDRAAAKRAGEEERPDHADRKPEAVSQPARKQSLRPAHHPLPLRIFFAIVSLGFVSSVLTGIYMAYKYNRNRMLVTGALLAGIVVPVMLAFL